MTNNYTDSVSAEVRAEMARQRLTVRQLAIAASLGRSYLQRRLSSKTAWSTDDLDAIADALGVPVSTFTSPRAAERTA